MWWTLGASVVVGLCTVLLWYWLVASWNRRRARALLVNLEAAFVGQGEVDHVEWVSASQFHLNLRLVSSAFVQPRVSVQLLPREMPVNWMMALIRKRRETVTFEANLLCAPGFNLEVHNQRWRGKTCSRRMKKAGVVRLKHVGPFILTSRRDWQKEITNMVHALSVSRDCDLLSVSFRRSAPHFSATMALETISGQECAPVKVLDVLRELASGASAARF